MGPQIGCCILDRRSAGVGWLEKWIDTTKQIWKNYRNGGGGLNVLNQKAHLCCAPIWSCYYLRGGQAVIIMWKHRDCLEFMWVQTEVLKLLEQKGKKDTVSQSESKYRLGSSKCQEVALPNLSFGFLDKRQKVKLIGIFPLWELVVHLFIQKAPEMSNFLWITFRWLVSQNIFFHYFGSHKVKTNI